MHSRSRKIASAIAAVGLFSIVPSGQAQSTTNWAGTNSTNWTDPGNWSALVPGTSTIADFNGSGSGNVNITLGGTTQTLAAIQFDTASAASYDLGVTSGDTFSLGDGSINVTGPLGVISVSSLVANPEEIDGNISLTNTAAFITDAAANGPLTLGASGGSGVLSLPTSSSTSISLSNGAVITLNDSIHGTLSNIVLPASTSGTVVFKGLSTYTGNTTQSSNNAVTIQIGSSTDTNNSATFTQGPFGKSTVIFNNTSNSPLQAVGADQTVANPLTLTFGFTVTDAATPHNLSLTGPMALGNSGRTITDNAFGQVVTLGASPNSTTLTLPNASGTTTNFAVSSVNADGTKPATLIVNNIIQNGSSAGSIGISSPNNNVPSGIIQINGANTYTGGTTYTGQSIGFLQGTIVQVGVSSVGTPGSLTSGPFGTGTLKWNGNGNSPGTLQPFGADRTIGNAITVGNSGFFVTDPSSAQDPTVTPTVVHSLTLSGAIGGDAKTITNNIQSGGALILGTAGSPSTLVLASGAKFQSQVGSGAGGITIINDLMSGSSVTFQQGGVYYINNPGNTYTGTTTLTGNGPVGTGATLAGTGNVGAGVSVLTVSSTTAASQGGIVAPGGDGATNLTGIGTLVVPNLAIDPLGQYVYQFDPTNAAVGGTTNDLISIVGNLNVSGLATGKFDLNLAPLAAGAPQAQYTLATFATLTGATAGQDVTADISFSGTTPAGYTPTVTVGPGGTSLLLNFAAVPEPGTLSLLGIAGLALVRRRRR